MENGSENETNSITNDQSKKVKFLWIPFLRQLSIAIAICTVYFVNGLFFGTPTVMIPQLRLEMNSTTTTFNEDLAPWISSIFAIGGMPWVIILPVLFERIGRKYTCVTICIVTITGYIVIYTSNSPVQVLIGEVIFGIQVTASQTVMAVIMTEYTAPQYRGLFLTIKSASYLWGLWVANAIGTYLHWKNIGTLGYVSYIYIITVLMWPESPYWLATKGMFDECAAAHRWLKGTDFKSEQELTELIKSQKRAVFVAKESTFMKFKKIILLPEFYKPTLIGMLTVTQYYVSGKVVCSMYAIEIMNRITDAKAAAYKTMLILDGVTVFGAYIGSFLSKIFRRRTLLRSTTSVAILFLFILSLYLYLVKLSLLSENDIVSISLLTVYSTAISSGSMILITCIISKLLPLRYKSWCILVIALFTNILNFSILRGAPDIFRLLGLHGTFLFYGICSSVCLFFVYKYLPETKDITLQEIEKCFKSPSSFKEESTKPFMNSVNVNSKNKINKLE